MATSLSQKPCSKAVCVAPLRPSFTSQAEILAVSPVATHPCSDRFDMSRFIPPTDAGPGRVFLLLGRLARDVRPCAKFVSRLQSNSKALGAFTGPPPDSHRADAIRAQQNNPCPRDILLCANSRHDHGLEPLTIRPSYLLGSLHASQRRRLSCPFPMSESGQTRKSVTATRTSAFRGKAEVDFGRLDFRV